MITDKDIAEGDLIMAEYYTAFGANNAENSVYANVSRIRTEAAEQARKEARATIERQAALIREMRAKLLIGGMQATNDMKQFRSIPVDVNIISDFIKRTKEYAE